MFNVLSEINWLAVLASTVVFALVGGVYFSVIAARDMPSLWATRTGNSRSPVPSSLSDPSFPAS